jgi:hypothetical protein
MILLGTTLFLVSATSVAYPLRFLMIPNRMVALCLVVLSFIVVGAAADSEQARVASASMSSGTIKMPVAE